MSYIVRVVGTGMSPIESKEFAELDRAVTCFGRRCYVFSDASKARVLLVEKTEDVETVRMTVEIA